VSIEFESVVTRLIRLIYHAQEAEDDYLSSLSEGERSARGTYQEWAPKDMIAHINYWRKRTIETLAYHSRGQQPPEYPDYELMNYENFEENLDIPLERLVRESRSTLKAMEEVLRRFEDEDLTNPVRYPWRNGQPLITLIANAAYLHILTHICQSYLKTGDQAAVFRLQQAACVNIHELDDHPVSREYNIYNLACFFAQTGNADKAIELLAKVLPASPALTEWARQDADLARLQDDPRYLALINT